MEQNTEGINPNLEADEEEVLEEVEDLYDGLEAMSDD
jgi:hypothetical protein